MTRVCCLGAAVTRCSWLGLLLSKATPVAREAAAPTPSLWASADPTRPGPHPPSTEAPLSSAHSQQPRHLRSTRPFPAARRLGRAPWDPAVREGQTRAGPEKRAVCPCPPPCTLPVAPGREGSGHGSPRLGRGDSPRAASCPQPWAPGHLGPWDGQAKVSWGCCLAASPLWAAAPAAEQTFETGNENPGCTDTLEHRKETPVDEVPGAWGWGSAPSPRRDPRGKAPHLARVRQARRG